MVSFRRFRLGMLATAALLIAPSAASAAWTTPTTPNPDGAIASKLRAVDCTSAASCIAVGNASFTEAPFTRPLAERWDGTSWQILPTPNPPGFASLNGVSCPWPSVCFAVGNSSTGPLVGVWNGTRWSIQSTPDVPGGVLTAVSCSGLLACTAVGFVVGPGEPPTTDAALALRWEGVGWHVQPTPNPAGSDRLYAVSCPLKRTCTAVGESTSEAAPYTSPLVTRWFGRVNAWGLQSAAKPDGAERAGLGGVSCPVAPVCVAVGSFNLPLEPVTLLAERRIGQNWSLLPTPPLPQPGGFPVPTLQAVSCPTLVLCRAVGRAPSSNGSIPIAERFDGTNWQLESIPYTTQVSGFPLLAGVSCPSRFFCMAVGDDSNRFGVPGVTLSAKWTP